MPFWLPVLFLCFKHFCSLGSWYETNLISLRFLTCCLLLTVPGVLVPSNTVLLKYLFRFFFCSIVLFLGKFASNLLKLNCSVVSWKGLYYFFKGNLHWLIFYNNIYVRMNQLTKASDCILPYRTSIKSPLHPICLKEIIFLGLFKTFHSKIKRLVTMSSKIRL